MSMARRPSNSPKSPAAWNRLHVHCMGRGGPVIGFSGTMRFKRSDFGFTALLGVASDEIEMVLDAEFDKTA